MRRRPLARASPEEPDRIDRVVRDRPATLARWALASWAVIASAIAVEAAGGPRSVWPLLAFPVFVLTAMASASLFHRDPERTGLDAVRAGLLAAIPSAVLLGRAAMRSFVAPSVGGIVVVCMAGATIGSVVGALAGPVAGWAIRSARPFLRPGRRR